MAAQRSSRPLLRRKAAILALRSAIAASHACISASISARVVGDDVLGKPAKLSVLGCGAAVEPEGDEGTVGSHAGVRAGAAGIKWVLSTHPWSFLPGREPVRQGRVDGLTPKGDYSV